MKIGQGYDCSVKMQWEKYIKKAEEFLKLKGNIVRNRGMRTNGYKLVMSKHCLCLEIIMKILTVKTEGKVS